jgi:hypothetical protein
MQHGIIMHGANTTETYIVKFLNYTIILNQVSQY